MEGLAKISSFSQKALGAFLVVLRLVILGICIVWKQYKLISTKYKYTWTIDKKSSRFSYRKKKTTKAGEYCSICLSEFEDREEGREVVECKHSFHRHCLEKWLLTGYYNKATCPLCRSLVVPEVIVAEYQRVQIEKDIRY
ncbi:RING-H2 finger protein atl17 [Phtheirospermum japonicum]|uniref:RING-H2 finger protein atl17 n=1 Tax=Phtheirospermum japonicum TaxID=374723 RepID=A0A830CCB9_9LAMI|nr:RING-H2 finger protein atl17 [Phtheirospermum japonicum]